MNDDAQIIWIRKTEGIGEHLQKGEWRKAFEATADLAHELADHLNIDFDQYYDD